MAKPLADDDWRDLPERMRMAEAAAFEEFSATFLPALGEYFRRGGASITDAEDLAVSCVSDICLQIARYERYPSAKFSTWVFSVARHKRADWQRRHFRFPDTVPLDDLGESDLLAKGNQPGDSAPPEEMVRDAVRDAVNRLSRLQRTILELIYKGIASDATEVGKILGISPGTVRVQHFRARNRIRAMLERDHRMKSRLKRANAVSF